jgi:hypothetical protein
VKTFFLSLCKLFEIVSLYKAHRSVLSSVKTLSLSLSLSLSPQPLLLIDDGTMFIKSEIQQIAEFNTVGTSA